MLSCGKMHTLMLKFDQTENLDSLFNLMFLDLRCNKISSTADAAALGPVWNALENLTNTIYSVTSYLVQLVNLKTLYLSSDDSSDNNPGKEDTGMECKSAGELIA